MIRQDGKLFPAHPELAAQGPSEPYAISSSEPGNVADTNIPASRSATAPLGDALTKINLFPDRQRAGTLNVDSPQTKTLPEQSVVSRPLSMTEAAAFESLYSNSYSEARERFLRAAAAAQAQVTSLPILSTDLSGKPLSIDIASIGSPTATKHLLVIGGTHGIEGYTGCAAQLALLERLPHGLDSNTSVHLINCLNPYGMLHGRRTTEGNIDLNRNFTSEFSGALPAYKMFNSVLNPSEPSRSRLFGYANLVFQVLRHIFPNIPAGYSKLRTGVLTGQYENEAGIFFGGKAPAHEQQVISSWIQNTLSNAESVFGIDIHAGLGSWGNESRFFEFPIESEKFHRAESRLGLQLTGLGPERKSYRPRGAIADAIPALLPKAEVTWILQEFGTYNPFRVLSALINENAAFLSAQSEAARSKTLAKKSSSSSIAQHIPTWIRDEMLEVFNPSNPQWRRETVARVVTLAQHGLQFLANS